MECHLEGLEISLIDTQEVVEEVSFIVATGLASPINGYRDLA